MYTYRCIHIDIEIFIYSKKQNQRPKNMMCSLGPQTKCRTNHKVTKSKSGWGGWTLVSTWLWPTLIVETIFRFLPAACLAYTHTHTQTHTDELKILAHCLLTHTWLIHLCDTTHLKSGTRVFSYLQCSYACVPWLMPMCDITHSHAWHDLSMCVTWLIQVCDMTHSCVCMTQSPPLWIQFHTHQHTRIHTHTHTHTLWCIDATWLMHVGDTLMHVGDMLIHVGDTLMHMCDTWHSWGCITLSCLCLHALCCSVLQFVAVYCGVVAACGSVW